MSYDFIRPSSSCPRLALPQVTLCAVTSVNVEATLRAMRICCDQIAFAECKIFTHKNIDVNHPDFHPEISVVTIDKICCSADYSRFLLVDLVRYVTTSHALVVQWDGHVIDALRWSEKFLDYDYIGASWPQFDDGHDVGNGGFSLRSRRLMDACRDPSFDSIHPEDLAIGRRNRTWLEKRGICFAPRDLADAFSTERAGDPATSFGYHGAFNIPRAVGVEAFWQTYLELDERSTVWRDLGNLLRELGRGRRACIRQLRMLADYLLAGIRQWWR